MIIITIVRTTKPTDSYDYDYNALMTMLTSTIFGSHQIQMLLTTLFSLSFVSTKFCDFRDFEKIVKFNTCELKDTIPDSNVAYYLILT